MYVEVLRNDLASTFLLVPLPSAQQAFFSRNHCVMTALLQDVDVQLVLFLVFESEHKWLIVYVHNVQQGQRQWYRIRQDRMTFADDTTEFSPVLKIVADASLTCTYAAYRSKF